MQRDTIFVSYAREDSASRDALLKQLEVILGQPPRIPIFADSSIDIGEEWRQRIIEEMDRALVVVLLVSADLLTSEFVKTIEIPLAALAAKRADTTIACLYVRPCPAIRTKLTLGFAVAALVPLLLFFFGLSGVLDTEISRARKTNLLDRIGPVKTAIEEVRDDVRRTARLLLRDEGLEAALRAEEPEVYLERTDARVRELATVGGLPGPGRVFLQDVFDRGEDTGPRTFPRAVRPGRSVW